MARDVDRIRRGAVEGVAQVLTPAEVLALLDRLSELERMVIELPEWTCPSCGSVTRARMADHTG